MSPNLARANSLQYQIIRHWHCEVNKTANEMAILKLIQTTVLDTRE